MSEDQPRAAWAALLWIALLPASLAAAHDRLHDEQGHLLDAYCSPVRNHCAKGGAVPIWGGEPWRNMWSGYMDCTSDGDCVCRKGTPCYLPPEGLMCTINGVTANCGSPSDTFWSRDVLERKARQ